MPLLLMAMSSMTGVAVVVVRHILSPLLASLGMRQVSQPKELDQAVVVFVVLMLVGVHAVREDDDLATRPANVVPPAGLQVSVVKDQGRLVVIGAVDFLNNPG